MILENVITFAKTCTTSNDVLLYKQLLYVKKKLRRKSPTAYFFDVIMGSYDDTKMIKFVGHLIT